MTNTHSLTHSHRHTHTWGRGGMQSGVCRCCGRSDRQVHDGETSDEYAKQSWTYKYAKKASARRHVGVQRRGRGIRFNTRSYGGSPSHGTTPPRHIHSLLHRHEITHVAIHTHKYVTRLKHSQVERGTRTSTQNTLHTPAVTLRKTLSRSSKTRHGAIRVDGAQVHICTDWTQRKGNNMFPVRRVACRVMHVARW